MDKIKVLIVDDEKDLSMSIQRFLGKLGYFTILASNGKEAFQAFLDNDVNIIISDIKMPVMDGIKLLKMVKESDRKSFFILMTGFSEILETKSAFELGADGFLAKPFRQKDLKQLIEVYLNKDDTPREMGLDNNYAGIDIDSMQNGSMLNCPIYIRLRDDKYVKIAAKGEDIAYSRIENYKSKGVDKLHLLKSDYENIMNLTKKLTKAVSTEAVKISTDKKVKFLEGATSIIMQDVFSNSIDKDVFDEANELYKSSLSQSLDNSGLFKIIESLMKRSDKLYAHSVCVAMFSTLLARKLEWISEKNKTAISMGAMFHDIGKQSISPDILGKSLIDLDYEEKKEIEKHPAYGSEILQQIPKISEDIVRIALEHHENCTGRGYPTGKDKQHIHPLARMVSIPNEFMNIVETFDDTLSNDEKFYQAIKKLKVLKPKHFDADFFAAFINLFDFSDQLIEELENE